LHPPRAQEERPNEKPVRPKPPNEVRLAGTAATLVEDEVRLDDDEEPQMGRER
jgi:hypothetical protein